MGTLPTSGPHDIQCGYRRGRILLRSGYRCTIVSHRVTSTWSSANGPMNGGFQPSPRNFGKNNRRRGRTGRNTAFGNPSAQEMKNGPGKDNTDRTKGQ
jgi:hypothetical protein